MNSSTGRYPFLSRCDCCYAIASMSADGDKAIAKTDTTWAKRNATSLRQLSAHLRPARPAGRWLLLGRELIKRVRADDGPDGIFCIFSTT